jgi:hypothetical protein
MMKLFALAMLLCASQAKIEAYKHVLNGQTPLTKEVMNSLYAEYKNEFRDPDVEKFILSRGGDRISIFEATVRDIVAHNSKG